MTLNTGNPTMTRDQLGEMTLLDDLANVGMTTRWDSTTPPRYTNNTPGTLPSPSTLWKRVLGTGTPGTGGVQGVTTGNDIGYLISNGAGSTGEPPPCSGPPDMCMLGQDVVGGFLALRRTTAAAASD